MNLTELKNKAFENKEVKKEYDELSYEFELVNQLISIRKSSGLTQEEIAHRMGTSKSNVCRLEKLGCHPKVSTIEKYARACGFKIGFNFNHI
jgi:transcriptional regulator with XRE-family HTH domain